VISAGAIVALSALLTALPARAGDFIGIYADDAFFGSPEYRSTAFQAQADARVEVVRQPFDWRRIETSPGAYDFSAYDDFVLRAAAAGLRVLPVLGNPPAFRALTATSDSVWSPPASNLDFADFAVKLVGRYGPHGSLWAAHPEIPALPIHSWQIWNEPNLRAFWATGPNAAQYTALLRTASSAIHVADPSAEVVAAGLPDSLLGIRLEDYMAQMFMAGAKGSFDTFAVHPYAATPATAVDIVALVRSVLTAYGDDSPVWVTEVGWATGGPFSPLTVSEPVQASNITDLLAGLGVRRAALGLRGVVVFRWRDAIAGNDSWPLHAGLLRSDGSAKPALASFRAGAAALTRTAAAVDGVATQPSGGGDATALPLVEQASGPPVQPTRARVAIRGGELSRFGFLRLHLSCRDLPCSGRVKARQADGACAGARAVSLAPGQLAAMRVALRRTRASCRRLLVTVTTSAAEPVAAAYVPARRAVSRAAG
jgi:hypothetical protein